MKKLIRTLLLTYAIGSSLILSAQTNYFIAPNGKDTNKGTIQSPFRSIEKAQAEARKADGKVTIYVRQGKYLISQPIVFTPQDGGDTKQLLLCTYPGENAVISSGIPLKLNWKSYKDGIMKAVVANPQLNFDVLVVNGNIRSMARYPNYDSIAVRFNGTAEDATSPARIKGWKNPEGGYLHAMHSRDWGDFHFRITGKKDSGELLLEGGWQNNRQSGLHKQNRMVENIFEELDAPGEWYFDKKEAMLYYYPLPGEDINKALFEVPQLKHLIEFRGTEQNPVRNITVDGIELTQTVRTFMEKYEPLLRSDWTVYRGGAIFLEGTENCAVTNCYLHNLGGNGIFFSNYNRNATVSGSHLTRIGASAVCFVGNPNAVRSPSFEYAQSVPVKEMDRTPGPKNNDYPTHCLVYDNLIHSIGMFEKQITGVEMSMCQYITVSHNSIYDTPRAGINVSEGTWGGHIIEFNDVFDTVKETGDHGSFNSWGRDRFWHSSAKVVESLIRDNNSLILADVVASITIRNNRFRCDRGWDIDLDDGSSNYHIYNNLCLNGGLKLREGFYRVVENNIMVNNSFHPHVWFKNSGDVFARNLVMSSYRPIGIEYWGTEVDYNIFADSIAYNNARKNQTDEHSIVYPITFRNPQAGDYRVSDASDAIFRIGFRNFDMDRFGVASPRLKQLAKQPVMPTPFSEKDIATQKNIVIWENMRLKNLDTLGERSATGMDSERGVYIISLDSHRSSFRDLLRSNDVILNFGGTPVYQLEDLKKAVQQVDLKNPQKIIIFRNQKENTLTLPGNIIKGAW